jgi:hypothetical protein
MVWHVFIVWSSILFMFVIIIIPMPGLLFSDVWDRRIHCQPVQPGINIRIPIKWRDRLPCLDKDLLKQVLSIGFAIRVDTTQMFESGLILTDNLGELLLCYSHFTNCKFNLFTPVHYISRLSTGKTYMFRQIDVRSNRKGMKRTKIELLSDIIYVLNLFGYNWSRYKVNFWNCLRKQLI